MVTQEQLLQQRGIAARLERRQESQRQADIRREQQIQQQRQVEAQRQQAELQRQQKVAAQEKAVYDEAVKALENQIKYGSFKFRVSPAAMKIYREFEKDPDIARAIERGGDVAIASRKAGFKSPQAYQQFQALIPQQQIDFEKAKTQVLLQSSPALKVLTGETFQKELAETRVIRGKGILPQGGIFDSQRVSVAPDTTGAVLPEQTLLEKTKANLFQVKETLRKGFNFGEEEPTVKERVILAGTIPEEVRTATKETLTEVVPEFEYTKEGKPIKVVQPILGSQTLQTIPTKEGLMQIGSKENIFTPEYTLSKEKVVGATANILSTGLYFTPVGAAALVGQTTQAFSTQKEKEIVLKDILESRPRGVSDEEWNKYVKESKDYVAEYNKQVRSYNKQVRTQKILTAGATALYFAPVIWGAGSKTISRLARFETKAGISGGIGQRLQSLSNSQRVTGLTKEELGRLASIDPFTKEAAQLRLKSIRFLEKRGDKVGIRAMQEMFSPELTSLSKGKSVSLFGIDVSKGVYPSQEKQAQQILKLRAEKVKNFPFTAEPTEFKRIVIGKEQLTKTQLSTMADDLVGLGIYRTKKEALKSVTETGYGTYTSTLGRTRTVEIPKAPFTKTETGAILKIQTKNLPPLKYNPYTGSVKLKSNALYLSRKIPKGKVDLRWQLGNKGRIGKLDVAITPPKSKYSVIKTFERGRKSISTLKSREGLMLKKYFGQPIRETGTYIVSPKAQRIVKLGRGMELYDVSSIYKRVSKKTKRGGSEMIADFLDLSVQPTQRKLSTLFKTSKEVERQRMGGLLVPVKGEISFTQVGLKRTKFPAVDETIFLGEALDLTKTYKRRTFGISYPSNIFTAGKVELPKPTRYFGQTSGRQKLIQQTITEKRVLLPALKPKLPVSRTVLPKVTKVTEESFMFAPRMVGGLGIGTSQWYGISGKAVEEFSFISAPRINQISSLGSRGVTLQRPITITRVRSISTTVSRFLTTPKTETSLNVGVKTQQIPKVQQQLKLSLAQSTLQRQLTPTESVERSLTKLKDFALDSFRQRKPPVPPPLKIKAGATTTAKQQVGRIFEVFKRTRGVDVKAGEEFTLRGATKKLAKELRGGLEASAFIKEKRTGRKIKSEELLGFLGGEFAPSKVDLFRIVQKREKRLGTRPEVFKIQKARKTSGGGKINWLS